MRVYAQIRFEKSYFNKNFYHNIPAKWHIWTDDPIGKCTQFYNYGDTREEAISGFVAALKEMGYSGKLRVYGDKAI